MSEKEKVLKSKSVEEQIEDINSIEVKNKEVDLILDTGYKCISCGKIISFHQAVSNKNSREDNDPASCWFCYSCKPPVPERSRADEHPGPGRPRNLDHPNVMLNEEVKNQIGGM